MFILCFFYILLSNQHQLSLFDPFFVCADVHSTQHSRHAAQLPRCHHYVLQAADVWMHGRQRSQRFGPGVYAMFSFSTLLHTGIRLVLGLLAPQPPARLAAAVLSHRPPRTPSPPPSHAPAAHVAARLPARQRPADARHFSPARPEMRLCGGRAGGVNTRFNGAGIVLTETLNGQGGKPWHSLIFLKMNTLFQRSRFDLLPIVAFISVQTWEEPLWGKKM